MLRPPVRVCFVCSGNICRSPTGEVVLTALAKRSGRGELIVADSAGTGDWHAGEDMDARARATLDAAGYAPRPHVAKQFTPADFADRDVVVALDGGHWRELWRAAGRTPDPDAARAKLVLLRRFDPKLAPGEDPDVGDPYYGGPDGFAEVLDQVERSCARLLDAIDEAVRSGADAVQQPESPSR